ncbi:putative dehydrogenase [Anseongella ginsenosidimutans]|uniref:Putative dehydrogenase n=1 Tax=Anseongella ginsenosidimutans TaxID=496056 RepID=A0A4R3KWY5_9SPHI|nr:Gfo/Idh/MocA family oxidoreductase [Anseongella ginsenosidimutans]QEC51385.1 Gfo/Idh/MocA family oxidoreductase [Anseongella ginsenosidimutans]TCS89911.1 putative dehydrogenase [Anseongella ginsenosidimutans]
MKRRKFLQSSFASATLFTIVPRQVLGKGFTAPSDQVTLGVIGTGKQSHGLTGQFIKLDGCRVVAACDVYKGKLDRFVKEVNGRYAEKLGKSSYNATLGFDNYRELLEKIDAVIIATPDHWHAIPAIEAMEAGKDVYCEKPLSHTVEEGRAMVSAARKHQRILQTGSMQRSRESFRHACELVQNGYIGEVKTVKVNVGDPAVSCDLPAEASPRGLDWNAWLGPAPQRPFNSVMAPPLSFDGFPNWRLYGEYGGGILSDWGAHMFDIAQWALGMDNSGPVELIPPPDREAKRGMQFRYENGVIMTHEDFGRGFAVEFNGTEGQLQVSREFLETNPASIASQVIKSGEKRLYKSDNHYLDWLNCIKSRELPVCDVETGHRSATVCHLANIAYQLGISLEWDPVKERFKDSKANKLLGKKYRKPYHIGI